MAFFDFSADHVLEDDVVRLRPLHADDWEALRPYADETALWKFSTIRVQNAEDLKAYISLALDGRTKREEYPFSVFDKRRNRYAGSTRFYDIQPEKGTLQLGYTWYGTEFHGSGLNRHSKFLLLRFAFETLGMERVEFRADVLNEKSVAAMKSIGCTVEGVLRSHIPKPDGTRRDTVVLGILRHEWFDSVRGALAQKL